MEKSDKVRIMSHFSPGHETSVILYLVPHFSEVETVDIWLDLTMIKVEAY